MSHHNITMIMFDHVPGAGKFPDELKAKIVGFNPKDVEAHLQSEVFKDRAVRVEKIATCMGCVMATCVADVERLPTIVNGMVKWARPIIKANAQKAQVCTEWRKQLEPQHVLGGGMDVTGMLRKAHKMMMPGSEMDDLGSVELGAEHMEHMVMRLEGASVDSGETHLSVDEEEEEKENGPEKGTKSNESMPTGKLRPLAIV